MIRVVFRAAAAVLCSWRQPATGPLMRSSSVNTVRASGSITGAGGTRTFDSIELPELAFTIGSSTVALRPARVTLPRLAVIGGECCVGNAGHDLLTQTPGFTIDLGTMTLRLD